MLLSSLDSGLLDERIIPRPRLELIKARYALARQLSQGSRLLAPYSRFKGKFLRQVDFYTLGDKGQEEVKGTFNYFHLQARRFKNLERRLTRRSVHETGRFIFESVLASRGVSRTSPRSQVRASFGADYVTLKFGSKTDYVAFCDEHLRASQRQVDWGMYAQFMVYESHVPFCIINAQSSDEAHFTKIHEEQHHLNWHYGVEPVMDELVARIREGYTDLEVGFFEDCGDITLPDFLVPWLDTVSAQLSDSGGISRGHSLYWGHLAFHLVDMDPMDATNAIAQFQRTYPTLSRFYEANM